MLTRSQSGDDPDITDTELQAAKFIVPFNDSIPTGPPPAIEDMQAPSKSSSPATEEKRSPRIISLAPSPIHSVRVPPQHVPESRRFSSIFYHNGVRGHRYHVLNGPDGSPGAWYYNSEEYEKVRKEREQKEFEEISRDCKQQ